ncbi:GspH/FimT family pseudopilin [Thiofaba sp. EF100]|uniref:GspH/FimT family pseudopilin n=1 Tax=Thiofaba sp. EF100 TaxID=3121274 RepID=UPI00322165D9
MRTSPAGKGFTLIELLVVMLIAGLVLTVTPPLLTAALPGLQARSSAQQLAAGLRMARGQAMAGGGEAVLVLDLARHSFRVGSRPEVRLGRSLELRLDTAASELEGEQRGGIRFFGDGSSTGGRITLRAGKHAWQVDVDWLTGRVTVDEAV